MNSADIILMKFKILILLFSYLAVGCTKFASTSFDKGSSEGGDSSSPPIESTKNDLDLENLVISNLTSTSMDISINFSGDDNNNSIVRLYMCSVKQSQGCDPEAGDMVTLTKTGTSLTATVDLTTTQITPGDLLKYKLVSSDSDGLTGGQANGYSLVPNNSGVRTVNQLSFLNFGRDASGSDEATASAIDADGNLYLAGSSSGSFGEANAGFNDVVVMKITSSGVLDTSFGINGIAQLGKVTIGSGRANQRDYAEAITLDSEGNIFIAGHTYSSLGEDHRTDRDVFVAKFNSKGELDNSFATNGVAQLGNDTMGAGASGEDYVTDIELTSNNHVLVSGYTNGSLGESNGGSYDGFIAKFTDVGVLDTSFGGGSGIVQFGSVTATGSAAAYEIIEDMVLDDSDNIYATGSTEGAFDEANGGDEDIFVLKLTSAGVLDTSFSTNGVLHLGGSTLGAASTAQDDPKSIQRDASGNLYIAGYTNSDLGETGAGSEDVFVAKISPTGSLDTTFSGDGIVHFGSVTRSVATGTDYVYDLELGADGSIFLAGRTYSSFGEIRAGGFDAFVIKLTSSGILDTSFSSDGIFHMGSVTFSSGDKDENVWAMNLLPGGDLYIAGETYSDLDEAFGGVTDIFVAKVTAAGNLDSSFSSNGVLHFGSETLGLGASGDDEVRAIDIDSSGNLYLGGYTSGSLGEANAGGNDIFVAKILSTGSLDTSFGNNGVIQLGRTTMGDRADQDDTLSDLKVDSSGNIYLAGFTFSDLGETRAGGLDAFVAKLSSDGSLDLTYGGGDGITQLGNTTLTTADSNEEVSAMHLNSDGTVLITGFTTSDLEETGNGEDIFVAKLDNTGNLDTSFSTNGLLHMGTITIGAGATGNERATGIGVDGSSNVYITGYVNGNFEETNAGNNDIVVVKLTSAGAFDTSYDTNGIVHLGATTLPAGTQSEYARDLLVDSSGALYIGGHTQSSLGGETFGGGFGDALVIKLSAAGALDTSFSGDGIFQFGDNTLGAGANGSDEIHAISYDNSGNIVVGGFTDGSFEETNNNFNDAFIASLTSAGNLNTNLAVNGILHFGQTTLSSERTSDHDELYDLIIDSSGKIYGIGSSNGDMDGFNAGNDDAFLITFSPDG